jgi:hypothetical protein
LAVLTLGLLAVVVPASAEVVAFDRQAWLRDYEFLKIQLEHSYSNLAWFASPGSGNNLPALERRTRRALDAAEGDDDSKAAILGFVAGFHDGHLQPVPTLQPGLQSGGINVPAPAPRPALDKMSPVDGCAALGYAPVRGIAFSLPFESLSGSSIESDGVSRVFRSGIATSAHGTRFGVVRIPRFRPQDAPPASCVQAWKAEQAAHHRVDADVLRDKIADAWFEILAAQLKAFQKAGVAAVIVDVGGNTGGNDSGDWAARLFTSRDVHSARLLMSAAPSANGYFDEQLGTLRDTLSAHPQAAAQVKSALNNAVAAFERRKAGVAERNCDLSWVWQQQKPWSPSGCSRLIEAGFASGQVDYLPPGALGDRTVASSMYWAAAVDPLRGAWSGAVYILTDDKTASSAEMFSAIMQDNAIAKVVGVTTEGDGCGFMQDDAPVELPHSHLRFRVPNCVRLRADGTNEVAGVTPNLLVQPTQGEDTRARAARVLEVIDEDFRKTRQAAAH